VKLFITFLILLVPVFILSLQLIEIGKNEVKLQISNSKMEQVEFYKTSLEGEIERIVLLHQQYLSDKDLQKLSSLNLNLTEYERTELINRIFQKLYTLKNSSAYIEHVEVKIPSIRRSISTKTHIREFIMAHDLYERNNELIVRDGLIYLTMAYSPYNAQIPQFMIEIQLSIAYLEQSLQQFTVNGGAILFHPNLQISTPNIDVIPPKIIDMINNQEIDRDKELSLSTLKINDINYLTISGKSEILNTVIIVYLLEDKMVEIMNDYQGYYWLLGGITILMTLMFSYIIYQFIHKPIKTLVHSFKKVEQGEFDFQINSMFNDEFNYIYNGFNHMTNNLQRLIQESYLQKIHLYQAELKQLQAQINPHFLYNSFFILHRMIKYKHGKALFFSKHLGQYFKYITRNANQEVTLEEEYQHMISYLEIQQLRFSNRLEVSIDPPAPIFKKIKIPRLILQPIVENAFEHGLKNKMSEGNLFIYFTQQKDKLNVFVEDNGGITEKRVDELTESLFFKKWEMTGLLNIHRRLQLKFGYKSGLTFSVGKTNGLKVKVSIPIKGENDHV